MFWELYQQQRIGQAESTARQARSQSDQLRTRLNACEDKLDSLALACQAMWELLTENQANNMSVLRDKMQEIDGRDGKIDGKMTRVMRSCAKCSRALHARHRRCMYCGEEAEVENLFQS